jgi:hypothetical protein
MPHRCDGYWRGCRIEGGNGTMFFVKKPQMSSDEFKAALREAGFGVAQGWIVDVSGKCPGFSTLPSFNRGVVNRNATLSRAIWERDAEIRRRAAASAEHG